MANDYYNSQSHQQPFYNSSRPEPQPYSSDYHGGAPSVAAPSYHTHAPGGHLARSDSRLTDISSVAPYEASISDHVYDRPPLEQSQSSLGNNSQMYGQGGGGRAQDSRTGFRDDVPLKDMPGKTAVDPAYDGGTDHVYDAEPGRKRRLRDNGGVPPPSGGISAMWKNPRKFAWVTWILTIIQVSVFIAEIVKNAHLTGSPIEIHPAFNVMIGPSPYVLINMGARFVPCMHNVDGIQTRTTPIDWPCPNTTSSSVADCTLGELCGFAGFETLYEGNIKSTPEPDQWYRFILPMFLHAGIIHIGFNMLLQCTMGREMEIIIGPIRYFLVYMCSGIFGFVLGGNFAATGIASTGASGALFGILALTLLDLLYHWSERPSHWRDFAFIMLDVVISFVLGLLPGLDNFSHIGGFAMGIVLGLSILHSPSSLRQRIGEAPPYQAVDEYARPSTGEPTGITNFVKSPTGFFKGRKPAWWVWWLVRVLALVFVFVVFILLLNNFYFYRKTCSWCKYLSCLPINGWCNIGNLDLSDTTTNSTTKRSLLDSWDAVAALYQEP